MIPADTTPEAYRMQLDIWRRLGPEGRMKQALELMALTDDLIVAGIRGRHPSYTEEQVRLAAIRVKLPQKLFDTVYPQAKGLEP